VDDSKHVDPIRLDVADDPKGDLPELPEFRDLAAGQWELSNLLRPPSQAINNA
jgi:hypothetical protein